MAPVEPVIQEKELPVRAASLILLSAVSAGVLCPAPARAQTLSPYQRSVPAGEATATPIALTMIDAIERALDHNLGALYAEQRVGEAGGARWKALSELLPTLSGHLTATREQVNLAAFGFPLPAGIPSVVGPFNVYDARVFLTQSVYDAQKINEARAEEHKVEAARLDSRNARDIVVLISGNAYSLAVASSAMVEAARAQLDTAQALPQQTADLKENGLVAGLDGLRADVQLGTARQRLTAAQVEFDKRKLTLARIIGLPLGQTFTLTDQIRPFAFPDISLERAVR